jgi:hypothetical protein
LADKELTPYERGLAERFRAALFDNDAGYDEGPIDSEHPEFAAFMALALPPVKRRKKTKPQDAALTQTELFYENAE